MSCKEFSPNTPEELHDGMLQLKGNKIPKGLVSLEHLFDRKDGYVKQRDKEAPVVQSSGEYEQINIGTNEDPKFVNLGKCCSEEEKTRFISLLIEFKDVFAWCYDDLKNFKDGKFQHHIPLKLGVNPFRQKLRNFNPKVVEVIFHEVHKMLKAHII